MTVSALATCFAPPQRADAAQVEADHQELMETPLILQLLNSFPEPVMVLNPERQIVLANDPLAALLNVDPEKLLGLRPGEALNCIHTWDCASGCGTSKFCTQCGAVRSIWECSKSQTPQVQECRITCASAQGPVSLDLRVWATPLMHNPRFTVFVAKDTTDEKRRGILERVFFHDVLDAAAGFQGIVEAWPDLAAEEATKMQRMAESLTEELIEEIKSHRDLTAAERGDLAPAFREIDAGQLLMRLCTLYGHHTVAKGKTVGPPTFYGLETIYSDDVLLHRVLGNLIKNALEASRPGQGVDVRFENRAAPVFSIHNEGVMPASVQLQVFQRSFSTKQQRGHGLGTYSAKLLVERYLKGTIAFTSSVESGTTFTVTLPKRMPE